MDKKLEVEKWITVKGNHIPVFKGETVADALSRRYSKKEYKQVGAGDGRRYRMPDLKNKDQVYNFYKEKFTICSSHYRNDIARELGITGTPQEKIDQIAKHFTKKWEQEQSINNDQDQKEKQIAQNKEQAKQASTQKEAPKTNDKVEFRKVHDFDFEHLPRNFENSYNEQKIVIYRDQNGNELSCTRSFQGGIYTFRLTDDMGYDLTNYRRLMYNREDARTISNEMIKEAGDRLRQRAEYASRKHAVDDPLHGILGERKEVKADEVTGVINYIKDDDVINPNYSIYPQPKGNNYHNNCAICTAATIMHCKGYDVEAKTQEKHNHRGTESIFKVDMDNADNYILPSSTRTYGFITEALRNRLRGRFRNENPDLNRWDIENKVDAEIKKRSMPKGPERAAKAIEDKVKSWGNGSYGELCVQWANTSSAHSLFIFNDNGVVTIFDSQNAKGEILYKGFNQITYLMKECKANGTQLMRFDNAEFKPGMETEVEKMFKVRGKS